MSSSSSSSSSSTATTMLAALVLVVVLMAELARADLCQCGSRCSMYKREHHCTRCCTSVMRRRSVPFLSYPQEQLDALRAEHPKELGNGEDISEQLLAQIVEQVAQQQVVPQLRPKSSAPRQTVVLAPVAAVEVAQQPAQQQFHGLRARRHQKNVVQRLQQKSQQPLRLPATSETQPEEQQQQLQKVAQQPKQQWRRALMKLLLRRRRSSSNTVPSLRD